MKIILFFLIFSVVWIGVGLLMLSYFGRDRGNSKFRRILSKKVFGIGEPIDVQLQLVVPALGGTIPPRDVILCIDESGSMGAGPGSPLMEAIRASENFVHRCPPQIHIGIVRFDDRAEVACPLSEGQGPPLRALASLGSGGGTELHKALLACHDALAGGRDGVSKTIILISDGGSSKQPALKARDRLHERFDSLQILCIGLEQANYHIGHFHAELLKEIAGKDEHYFPVAQPADLESLFDYLFGYVSAGMAISGLVYEEVHAPCPFRVDSVGSYYPVGIHQAQSTQFTWSVPVLEERQVILSYRLIPTCWGWHSLDFQIGKARWKMPDEDKGNKKVIEVAGPRGPRVMVLHPALVWAWPILNPILGLIIGRRFCEAPENVSRATRKFSPIALPSLPSPPPLTSGHEHHTEIKPALVIGVGEAGASALCRLKFIASDRGIQADRLRFIHFDLTHAVNRPNPWYGNFELTEHERVYLNCDLRPYLEKLRDGSEITDAAWIPVGQWLADPLPVTAPQQADDRRKARLTLLLNPAEAEMRSGEALDPVLSQNGLVILTGAAEDSAFSGLAAEIAHICANKGSGVSLVISRWAKPDADENEIAAMVRELERLVLLRGDEVLSDRHKPPVAASRLFDRVIVQAKNAPDARQAGFGAADLIWPLIAYSKFDEHLGTPNTDSSQLFCWSVGCQSFYLPMEILWRWVSARCLCQALLSQWLGLVKSDESWVHPKPPAERIESWVQKFWSGENLGRPRGVVLEHAGRILTAPNPERAFAEAADVVPTENLYQIQVEFWQEERALFFDYCQTWMNQILTTEREKNEWGLLVLFHSLKDVREGFGKIETAMESLSGNQGFLQMTRMIGSLYRDMGCIIRDILARLEAWIAQTIGPLVEDEIGARAGGFYLVDALEQRRRDAQVDMAEFRPEIQNEAELMYLDWWERFGQALTGQLRFEVQRQPGQNMTIQLRLGDRLLDNPSHFLEAVDHWLGQYRFALSNWSWESLLRHTEFDEGQGQAFGSFLIGTHATELFPKITDVKDDTDPYFAGWFQPRQLPISEVFGWDQVSHRSLPFAWPEEAEAARLGRIVRHQLKERFEFSSPRLINLMRNPARLRVFLSDLGMGRIVEKNGSLWITRAGVEYLIGDGVINQEPSLAMEHFETAARYVVTRQISKDGRPLPLGDPSGEGLILKEIESQPIIESISKSQSWRQWKNLIIILEK